MYKVTFINFSLLNKKQMIMNDTNIISTYLEQQASDDQPTKIEIHTWPENIRGRRIFHTTVLDGEGRSLDCGSKFKERLANYPLINLSDHAVLDRHDMIVKQYLSKGYRITDSCYSPKFEKIKLGLLLHEIDIPDKL